jgi:hypothetical protein
LINGLIHVSLTLAVAHKYDAFRAIGEAYSFLVATSIAIAFVSCLREYFFAVRAQPKLSACRLFVLKSRGHPTEGSQHTLNFILNRKYKINDLWPFEALFYF